MRVGIVAGPFVPVPPTRYGGTELVLDVLARGLQEAGHDVELFTVGESTCAVPRRWEFEHAVEPMNQSTAEAVQVTAAHEALRGCDVVHDHTLVGPLAFGGRAGYPPLVTTCHSPFGERLRRVYREVARHVPVVAISHAQRASAPEVPVAAVIHHGLDLREFRLGAGKGEYLMLMSRMSPDKGPDRAIAIARAAGRPLVVAAKMREPDEVDYFHAVVEPLLGSDVELVGEVGRADRLRLLADAVALVNPIQWPEPFGLNMVEAMACGTPVLAHPLGAAPEIVTDGVTGFLRTDVAGLAACVDAAATLDRAACRASVERDFSMARMVEDHVVLYQRVLDGADDPVGSRKPEVVVDLRGARAS